MQFEGKSSQIVYCKQALVEQELLTFPEDLSLSPNISRVRVVLPLENKILSKAILLIAASVLSCTRRVSRSYNHLD